LIFSNIYAHNILQRKLSAYISKCFQLQGRMASASRSLGSHSRGRHERQRCGSFYGLCPGHSTGELTSLPDPIIGRRGEPLPIFFPSTPLAPQKSARGNHCVIYTHFSRCIVLR